MPFVLVACGRAPPKVQGPAAPQGLFISTNDCAESGKLSAELCGKAVDEAVAIHHSQAPHFATMRQCEAGFGLDRCDKGADGQYRPRIQAFLITMKDPPEGKPLYPSEPGKPGFRTADKASITNAAETYTVSNAAAAIGNENAKAVSNQGAAPLPGF